MKASSEPSKRRAPARGAVRVGTASWSDPGFVADWYPPDLPASKRLPWYAEHFKLVEVNSTFYALPRAPVTARWAEQTPDDFLFDVKLHQFFSWHSTPVKLLPADLRAKAKTVKEKVVRTASLEAALMDRFLEGIQPLYDADKMGALLLQLSPTFRPRENDLADLEPLFGLVSAHSLAVELRNRDWLIGSQKKETVAFFKEHKISLVTVDAPRAEHFMVMPSVDVVTNPALAYLRAHGRNAEGYIRGRTVAQRFDYDYPLKELKEIAQRAEDLSELTVETHVIFNNNKSSYAPKAAERLRRLMKT